MTCLIVAEAGVNHNGSPELALRLIDAAAEAGADAVKFQTFRAESLAAPGAKKAKYQEARTSAGDQRTMLKELELSESIHVALIKHCSECGIEFMSTPFDKESLEMLVALGIRRIKVPSGELTNLPFLAQVAATGLPIILSTGMATLEEVAEAVAEIETCRAPLRQSISGEPLTLLHCTSSYPTRPRDVNLKAMEAMQRTFGLPVGYSDHTDGTLVSALAVVLGAQVIEKHLTLDRSLPGPDHKASLNPRSFKKLVKEIRLAEISLGSGEKRPTAAELENRELVRRSVTLSRRLGAGTILSMDCLALLRPGGGIPPNQLREVVGRRLRSDMAEGSTLNWGDVE